jgi:hypothetical protein
MRVWLTLAVAVGLTVPGGRAQDIVRADFTEARGLAQWEIDGTGRWRMAGGMLSLFEAGVPAGPIRRPAAMAIFRSAPVGGFTLDVELRSTAPADLAVRDVLLIFGYQSPTRFYYVHLSARTDAVHNGMFLVHDADRRRLDPPAGVGRLTDRAWHRVRLEREAASGRARVFLDGGSAPVLSATDATIVSGRVGVGSFDETADFRLFEVTRTD